MTRLGPHSYGVAVDVRAGGRKISAESSWLTLFGFALAVAYWPWIAGAAATPRWLVLVIATATLLFALPNEARRMTWPHVTGGLFVGWVLLTWLWSPAPEAFDAAWKLILLALLFVVGARLESLTPLLIGAAAGIGISSVLVILERIGLIPSAGVNPAGLFVNGLYLAEFAAMVVAGLLAFGRWPWALLCAPALLVVNLPRGPLLALAFVAAVEVLRWRAALFAFIALTLPLAIWLRPLSVLDRLDTWADLIRGVTVFGHGLGSYVAAAFISDHSVRKTHANNDLLEIAYEFGLVGFFLACMFLGSLWPRRQVVKASDFESDIGSSNLPAAAIVVIVFLIVGLFGFPLHMPATAGLFALAAGHLARQA